MCKKIAFNPTEKKLIKLLWKDGEVQPNSNLEQRRVVLSKAGVLKGKSGTLCNLYAKLLELSFIEFDMRYKAKVLMPVMG